MFDNKTRQYFLKNRQYPLKTRQICWDQLVNLIVGENVKTRELLAYTRQYDVQTRQFHTNPNKNDIQCMQLHGKHRTSTKT